MSNETDLDWLARNVPLEQVRGWIQKAGEGFNIIPSGMPPAIFGQEMWFAAREVLARRAELQNKPGWAEAPRWATHRAQASDGRWFFFNGEPHSYKDAWLLGSATKAIHEKWKGEVLGDWRDTLEQRPADLSESAVTERLTEATQNVLAAVPALMDEKFSFDRNDWFERGELPPVGTECEIFLGGGWGRVFIAGVSRAGHPVAEFGTGKIAECDDCKFRPIRTEREVLLSIIVEEMNRYDTDGKLADAILAAGFSLGDK